GVRRGACGTLSGAGPFRHRPICERAARLGPRTDRGECRSVTFSFWSLDFIYYPVSGIMWVWHKIFGFLMGYDNAWAWVLSVVFLVFTLRAIMIKPFMKQMDAQVKMQAVQPEMKKIREKYKDDRQRLTEEMMK